MTTPERRTCGDSGGRKGNGEPCGSHISLSPEGLCLAHDPERQALAREMRAAGGRKSAAENKRRRDEAIAAKNAEKPQSANGIVFSGNTPPQPKTLEDAAGYLAHTAHAVANGQCDARTAHETTFALKGFMEAASKLVTVKRIAELKALIRTLTVCPSCAALRDAETAE
jgi:hypothetical protein